MLHPTTPPHGIAAARILLHALLTPPEPAAQCAPPVDVVQLADLALVALQALRSRGLHAVAVFLGEQLARALQGGDVRAPEVLAGVEALLGACGAVCAAGWEEDANGAVLRLWMVRAHCYCTMQCSRDA